MTDQDPWLEQFEARRKEREQADRSFTLLGETLVVKPNVAPEVGLRREAFQQKVAAYTVEVAEAQATGKEIPELGVDDEEFLALSESIIVACLEPDSLDAWKRLRDPAHPDPLSLMDIYGLSGFVLAKASRLPTVAPAASSNGQAPGARTSKAGSPSRAAVRKR
jgi:hypothetical protein